MSAAGAEVAEASLDGTEPPHAQWLVLGRRRIYILPTRAGYGFGFVLLVMLLGSANYNNGLGYAFTFLLGSVALVSLLHSYRNLAGLRFSRAATRAVFAGAEARFAVHVDNREQGQRYDVLIRYGEGAKDRAKTRVTRVELGRNDQIQVELALPARTRGWFRLPKAVIATRYPLGLFRAWSSLNLGCRCLVYPEPRGRRALPAAAAIANREAGARGRGRDDFIGLRDYRPGDSPRQIHWKAVAREQGIPFKLFSGEAPSDLELRWADTEGHTEERLSQLCRWVVEAHRQGYRYALSLPGLEIAREHGESHRARCLEALALFALPEYEPLLSPQ